MAEQPPPFSQIVADLPAAVPFVPPEEMERRTGVQVRLRLGANESSFGMSPLARKAMENSLEENYLYGDALSFDLKEELAARNGIPTKRIAVASGIDELLGWITRVFLNPGDSVTASLGSYPTFHYHVQGFGGRLHQVPYREGKNDLDALVETARATGSRILYLAHPDNPTGTWFTAAELKEFRQQLPTDCLLLLDEAYLEFAPEAAHLPLDPADSGVIRTRTFSKAYGMAGLRVGYAFASEEIITAFDKIRNHFGVSRIAQAGALAALKDDLFVQQVVKEVAAGRREYEALTEELGWTAYPSATNFVAIDTGEAHRAAAIQEALWQRGVFIRVPGVAPLNRCLRVSVGTPAERQEFARILREVVEAL
ncbi:histidinol-phosphate aminotransferase [Kroppenstedtia sanguinis]|uniref:histidinol-phosphate transaminase n=1 Tax=Kroppenstedtia sanguinis TaxID=1380684 RepID=A0ABW4CC59_9BACL